MALHVRENLYRGVNAHLHSLLQGSEGSWQSFHGAYITYLTEAIAELLPVGYYVLNEKSLQLVEVDTGAAISTRPDAAIFHQPARSVPGAGGAAMAATPPVRAIPVIDTLSDEDTLQAVVISAREGDAGIPVTRIEILSPANKPPGTHAAQYRAKRDATLWSGLNLVEIDYLHERRSPVQVVASYPDRDAGAAPYVILVSNPHPDLAQGEMLVYPFGVDDPIPAVSVPLAGEDAITVDFGGVYQRTFAANTYYGMVAVDYAQLPPRFESYAAEDQARIRARMAEASERSQQ